MSRHSPITPFKNLASIFLSKIHALTSLQLLNGLVPSDHLLIKKHASLRNYLAVQQTNLGGFKRAESGRLVVQISLQWLHSNLHFWILESESCQILQLLLELNAKKNIKQICLFFKPSNDMEHPPWCWFSLLPLVNWRLFRVCIFYCSPGHHLGDLSHHGSADRRQPESMRPTPGKYRLISTGKTAHRSISVMPHYYLLWLMATPDGVATELECGLGMYTTSPLSTISIPVSQFVHFLMLNWLVPSAWIIKASLSVTA